MRRIHHDPPHDRDRGLDLAFRVTNWTVTLEAVSGSATVFFSGYILGSRGGPHHGHHVVVKPFPGPEGRRGPGEPMGPGGPMGPDDGPRSVPLTPSSPTSTPPRP